MGPSSAQRAFTPKEDVQCIKHQASQSLHSVVCLKEIGRRDTLNSGCAYEKSASGDYPPNLGFIVSSLKLR